MHNLTSNLQYLMESRGVTSVNLANALLISPELIAKLKSGDLKNPTLNTVIGISKHFNISLEALVFDTLN